MSTVEMGWRAKVGTGLRPRSRTERRRLDPPSDNRQVSGKVLVYKHPGLHFGDIHKLTATHIDGLQEIVGDSKYDIFFPTSGSRSLADEMANSDFDGDMYWVSWNSQLCARYICKLLVNTHGSAVDTWSFSE
ncbi:probable RNA-dependent RNA polymerase 3 [Setaria italica]|uniref:probable RNA-dependent RNA polymerase 3 n=1 Tax=Setaria italica TaxID=4555 RepID=UPI000BE6102C|nr:probable RNA-dependent RNA polymerase 3 [Setaria italica]